jgi:hypothetical protein
MKRLTEFGGGKSYGSKSASQLLRDKTLNYRLEQAGIGKGRAGIDRVPKVNRASRRPCLGRPGYGLFRFISVSALKNSTRDIATSISAALISAALIYAALFMLPFIQPFHTALP